MKWKHVPAALLGAWASIAFAPAAFAIRDCIPIQDIRQSHVVNDRTILLELIGNEYKRVDLKIACPNMIFYGYSYATATTDFCSTDILHVNNTPGAVCTVKRIVNISSEEAKQLLKEPLKH